MTWFTRSSIERSLADERRDNPLPPDPKPHAHFHAHGGSRHGHVHNHADAASERPARMHAHSARSDTRAH